MNPGRGASYERRDADARPVFLAGSVLALLLVGSMAASAWLTQELTERLRARETASPVGHLRRPPEGPGLLSAPALELERHRAWEERLMSATEWIDPLNGIVRIPVERALELCLEQGFPVREGAR
jgi:hypothetical protein